MAHELRLTDVSAPTGGGCGSGACGCGHHGAAAGGHASGLAAHGDTPQTFEVAGMTCGHCVASVTEELSALGGVDQVAVDLVAGASSTVTVSADRALTRDEVRAAVEDAGYTLVQ